MNKKTAITVGVVAVVVIVLLYWLKEQEKKNIKIAEQKDDRIKDLEVNNLQLMRELLKAPVDIPDILRKQLLELVGSYELKNTDIAIELRSVVNLIENHELEKAVFTITKIIENILKSKFKNDDDFKKYMTDSNAKKRNPVFADFIEYAHRVKVLDKAERYAALSLKEQRNEEAHEIAVKREVNNNISSILIGIELITKCDAIGY